MAFLTRICANVVLCALLPITASATTYYVSQSAGNDSNNGTSQTTPFKTLAKANTLNHLKGGDSILLKRGDVWHEELVVPSSGTSATSHLVIGAYGTGAAPVIDGADTVTGWSLVTSNTYQSRRGTGTWKVFVDSIYSPTPSLTHLGSVNAVSKTAGSFYADDDTLYVHLADDSSPAKHTIEASGVTRTIGVFASNKSYVTVQDLEIVRTTNSGIAFVLDYGNQSGNAANQYNTLQGLTIFNTGSYAPMPTGFDGDIVVRANTSGGSLALKGWQILKNDAGMVDSPWGLNYNIAGIQLRGVTGALVQGNQVHTTNAMGIQDRPYGLATSCGKTTIDNNSLTDNEGNISAQCSNEVVTNNQVINSRGFGLQVHSYGYAGNNYIANLDRSRDHKLYNGIDGNGGDHVRYVNDTVINVYACSFTVEGQGATGVSVEGGTYDSNNASGCATYIMNTATPISISKNTKWVVNPRVPRPFGFMIQNPSDSAHRYTLSQFLALEK